MPILKALCGVETKARFRALAMSKGLTESMLLRHMVAAVIVQCGEPGAPLPRSETRGGRMGYGGQIKLRLRHAEVHAIRALAEPEGYSAQAWIVQQLRHRLEGAVPFAKEELSAQHDAIRELSAVGRNLNTLTHRMLRSGQFEAGLLDLQTLAKAVEQLRREMTATTTRASHRGRRADG